MNIALYILSFFEKCQFSIPRRSANVQYVYQSLLASKPGMNLSCHDSNRTPVEYHLPYFTISGKVFYRVKDVHEFLRNQFAAVEERAAKRKEKEVRKEERRRKKGLFP